MFYVSHSLILSKNAGFWENKGGMLCLRTNRFCKVNEHISVHLVISATVSQSVLKLLFYISSTFLLPLFRLSVKTNVFSVFSPLPLYFPTSFCFILPILFFSTVAIVVCWPSLTWVPGIFSGSKCSRHQLGSPSCVDRFNFTGYHHKPEMPRGGKKWSSAFTYIIFSCSSIVACRRCCDLRHLPVINIDNWHPLKNYCWKIAIGWGAYRPKSWPSGMHTNQGLTEPRLLSHPASR